VEDWVKEKIKAALERVDFGKIVLNIHEKEVISIDTIERRRQKKIENREG